MVLKINPHHQMLWRTPFEAQIGFGRNQVKLQQLTTEQEKFIDALYLGISPNQVDAVAKQSRLAAIQAHQLVEKLEPLMLRKLANPTDAPSALDVDRAFAEIARASLLNASDGEAVLLARSQRVVYLEKLDSTGLLLLNALAAAGVGTIITQDAAAVLNRDAGTSGYPQALIAKKRFAAAQLILDANHSRTRLVPPARVKLKQLERADFAVLSAQQILNPQSYASWVSKKTAHLAIVFDAPGAWVSGVIRPGQTPCLYCHHLGQLIDDASWGAIGTQLISSQLRFDDEATKLLAVGLAVQSILSELDGIAGFGSMLDHKGFRVDRELANVTEISWAKQPECSCQLLTQEVA